MDLLPVLSDIVQYVCSVIADMRFLYGVACCLTFAFARGGYRTLIALLLAESWAISNIGWQWNALVMFQPLDLAVACVGYAVWFETRARWAGAFTLIAASQLALHMIYELQGLSFQLTYLFLLDVTFAAELLVVSWRGMIDCGPAALLHIRDFLGRNFRVRSPKEVTRG